MIFDDIMNFYDIIVSKKNNIATLEEWKMHKASCEWSSKIRTVMRWATVLYSSSAWLITGCGQRCGLVVWPVSLQSNLESWQLYTHTCTHTHSIAMHSLQRANKQRVQLWTTLQLNQPWIEVIFFGRVSFWLQRKHIGLAVTVVRVRRYWFIVPQCIMWHAMLINNNRITAVACMCGS